MKTDLDRLIHDVLADTTATTPHDIAVEVLKRIPDAAAALAEALPVYVQVCLSRARMLTPSSDGATTSFRGVSRASRIRDDWDRRLQTPLWVGDEWKRLADCTADDLRTVAAELRDKAEKVLAKADWYEHLAALLPAGATVGSLSAAAVAA